MEIKILRKIKASKEPLTIKKIIAIGIKCNVTELSIEFAKFIYPKALYICSLEDNERVCIFLKTKYLLLHTFENHFMIEEHNNNFYTGKRFIYTIN